MKEVAYLLLYVDYSILTASSTQFLRCIISLLDLEFFMNDLGVLSYFIGIAESRDNNGLFISH